MSVSGSEISGVALTVAPGLTISGRVVFKSSLTPATPPPSLTGVRVALNAPWLLTLKPNTPIESLGFSPGAVVQADGTFRLLGMLPAHDRSPSVS